MYIQNFIYQEDICIQKLFTKNGRSQISMYPKKKKKETDKLQQP